MSAIVFIRHGETQMAGTFCGHSDPPLCHSGRRQIALAAVRVAALGIERIVASDLLRASQSAALLSRSLGAPVDHQPRLRELYFGLWEGLNWNQVEAQYPDEADEWLRHWPLRSAPGGELYEHFRARVAAEITPLLANPSAPNTALVTHRGVMFCALQDHFQFSQQEAWTQTACYGAVVVARPA